MRSQNAKRLLLSLSLGLFPAAFACSSSGSDSAELTPGVLSLQLQSGPAVELSEVSYQIMRPDGFLITGPVAISTGAPQDSFGFKVDKLQPSNSYSLTVFAQGQLVASQRPTKCRGHADFSIAAKQSTGVALILQCDGVVTEGSDHGGKRNRCPSVVSLRAAPDSAPVGSDVTIVADVADDEDGPDVLKYVWSTASGSFDGRTCESRFHCSFAGAVAVGLSVSDGDGACVDSKALVYVTCTTPECLAAGNCGTLTIDTSQPGPDKVTVTHFGAAGAAGDRNPETAGIGGADSQAGRSGGRIDFDFGAGIVTRPSHAGAGAAGSAGGAAGVAGVATVTAGASGSGVAGASSAGATATAGQPSTSDTASHGGAGGNGNDRRGGWPGAPGEGPRRGGHHSNVGGSGGSATSDQDAGVEP